MKLIKFVLFLIFVVIILINDSHAISRLTCGRKFKSISAKTKVLNTLNLIKNKNIYSYKIIPKPTNKKYALKYGKEKFNLKISADNCTKINDAFFFSGKNNVFVFNPKLQDISLTRKHLIYSEDRIWPENFVSDEECKNIVRNFIKKIGLDINEIEFLNTVSKRLIYKTKTVYIRRKIDGCLFIGRASIGDVEVTKDGEIRSADIGIGQFVKYKKNDKIIPVNNAYTNLLLGNGIFSNLSQEHYPGPDLNLGELEKIDIVYHTNGIDKLPDMILKPIYRFVFEKDNKGNKPWGYYPASE
jgi:hypothetical protein